MSDQEKCKNGDCHDGHICVLMSKNKLDAVRELVQNPKFICFNCGRVADDGHNLCNPMPLDDK